MKKQYTIIKHFVFFVVVFNSLFILVEVLGSPPIVRSLLRDIRTDRELSTYFESKTTFAFEGARLTALRSIWKKTCKLHDVLVKFFIFLISSFALYLILISIVLIKMLRRCRHLEKKEQDLLAQGRA